MIEVRINGKNVTLDLSDEVRDLIDEAVVAAINEDVIAKTGNMDFDISNGFSLDGGPMGEFSGDLRISYEYSEMEDEPDLFTEDSDDPDSFPDVDGDIELMDP